MSDKRKNSNDAGINNHIRLYIYRIPKESHDAMVHNKKQFFDKFQKNRILNYQTLQLNHSETSEGFVSLNNLVSSTDEEEIWLDLEVIQGQYTYG